MTKTSRLPSCFIPLLVSYDCLLWLFDGWRYYYGWCMDSLSCQLGWWIISRVGWVLFCIKIKPNCRGNRSEARSRPKHQKSNKIWKTRLSVVSISTYLPTFRRFIVGEPNWTWTMTARPSLCLVNCKGGNHGQQWHFYLLAYSSSSSSSS